MSRIKPYAKTVVAIVGAVCMVIAGEADVDTWASIVIAAATAAGVYQVPNSQ